MHCDLVVEGRLWYRGRLTQGCVGIDDGKIVTVKKILKGETNHRHGSMLILPGATDLHVHFRDPGLTKKEDFRTGTAAAAFGGVTTVLDMPNTDPATDRLSRYVEKWESVKAKALVDFGLIAALADAGEVVRMARIAPAYKAYLGPTTGGLKVPWDELGALTGAVPGHRALSVHAEDDSQFDEKVEPKDPAGWDRRRPVAAEASAIDRLAAASRRGFHIAHVSSPEGLAAAERARARGLAVTTEATPHHLLLNTKMDLGARGKVNPPLRSPQAAAALWDAFAQGRIDVLASDHAPHTEDDKDESFAEAPSGVPGVEFLLPLLLAKVGARKLPLGALVRTAAERPAEIVGMPKGRILPGYDGDLVVLDTRERRAITQRDVRSKCGWTPYLGHAAVFPRVVYVRGRRIVDRGELQAAPGAGTFQPGGWQPAPPKSKTVLMVDIPRGTSLAQAKALATGKHRAAPTPGPR